MTPRDGPSLLAAIERHVSPRLPPGRFARNVAIASLAGLVPALALYVALQPGLAGHLVAAEGAGGRFLRQVLTNGLPVVFAVNWAGFVLFSRLRAGAVAPWTALGLDIVARVGLFVVLHGAIFAASARLFGSFGGDPVQALRVVGPTLAGAAGFGNLSGVYLYATLVSALPLHAALVEGALGARPVRRRRIVALALLVFAVEAAVLTAVALTLARLG